ncbi:hypothetical protein HZU77_016395 [Neisseriaceae bacterium TC5R-5]|nr:hypothetical protein [Neisseriaceae bacterium TC5R-5]
MWYLLADANGLSGSETLVAGQVLKVPNKVTNIHNNSSTYRPYNPGQAIGDVSPTLPEPPPPPSRGGGGCGFLGTILILAVSVAVVVYTAGAAATMLGATTVSSAVGGSVAASTLGTLGAGMAALGGGLAGGAGLAAAAIGGAVGSIVGQGLSMAMGMQDKFSWSQVATSALGSAVTAGIGQQIGQVNSATTSWQMAGRAAAGNALTQGISVATGLQKSFNWTAVAASGVGAGISRAFSQEFMPGWTGENSGTWERIGAGTTSGLISGGLQSAIIGQRPNWGAIAAESFGSSLGDEVVQGIRQREDSAQLQRARTEAEQAEWARQVSGSWQMGGAGNEQDYSRLAWESLQYPTTEIMQTDNKGRIQSGDYWEEKRYQQQLNNQQAMNEGRALVVTDQMREMTETESFFTFNQAGRFLSGAANSAVGMGREFGALFEDSFDRGTALLADIWGIKGNEAPAARSALFQSLDQQGLGPTLGLAALNIVKTPSEIVQGLFSGDSYKAGGSAFDAALMVAPLAKVLPRRAGGVAVAGDIGALTKGEVTGSSLGKIVGQFSAIKPGPLADNLAETFAGGRYTTVTLQKDTIFYRAGIADQPLGQFFSQTPPIGVLQTRIDKAVLPRWPNGGASPIDTYFAVKIPAGTQVHIGNVGSQNGFYIGGTGQVVIPKPWTIPGVEVVNSGLLK